MLDIKLIRDDAEAVKTGLISRNADVDAIDEVLKLDANWRAKQTEAEERQAALNKANKAFGPWMGGRKKNPEMPAPKELIELLGETPADPETAKEKLRLLGEDKDKLQGEADAIMNQIEGLLLHLPNVPSASTPVGRSEADNVVRKEWGKKREFDFEPKAHWDLVGDKGLDLEIGGRISGSGFPFFRGKIAKLERALINYFLELHTAEHGYTECWTPFMVRAETLRNSSQLPKFYDDLYRADERDDLFLIPTAEVPLTSVHAGEIIPDENAPIRYCAFTPCFRREAGAAGKDTRGILRVHQFSKVELMVVTTPERSEEEHETLTRCAETVLEKLNIPYRRLELCTGDMGFGAARCYDLEAWAPGVGKWLEVSSCSNFTDFQARRAKIRVKSAEKKTRLAHTLNGSGLACPRTMIAILENNQQADGTINIPPALQPYYGAETL
ncbi:MAG: serine--tRNA ligase [Planctomycetes bacterium]|nr:serine--tRNA ligase [Planctomycetota bacterium]